MSSKSKGSARRPCERDGSCYTQSDALQLTGSKVKIEEDRASLYYGQGGSESSFTIHKSISVDGSLLGIGRKTTPSNLFDGNKTSASPSTIHCVKEPTGIRTEPPSEN